MTPDENPAEQENEKIGQDASGETAAQAESRASGPMVVGIGASAGGLAAMQRFFDALPPDPGIAFVVVTHLDPTRESILHELLQAHTPMPVRQVQGRVQITPDHVYVVPPNRRILVTDSHLDLAEFDEPRGMRTPIDYFYRSLAAAHRNSAAVILSGSGTDGAVGVKAIKEQGGLLLVQDPDEAEYDGMPSAAIATGLADLVLPVAELAEKLREYLRHPVHMPLDADELTAPQLDTLNRILAHVQARTGHDFSRYKHSTILRRIQRRMQLNGIFTLQQYLEFMRPKADEARSLFNDLLIGVTNFFRDREAWDILAERVLPNLFEGKSAGEGVRVWSIGCSTGEEAYSLGILLLEHAARIKEGLPKRIELQVFASDLDDEALARAREGLYPAVIEADVSSERLQRFFTREGDHYRVQRELRDIVLFTNHSVLRDPPFSRLDLISCRNLLIYLQRDVQENVFEIFHYALNPHCYLFLGNSESAEAMPGLFSVIDKTHRIYQARPWAGERPNLPMLPLSLHRSIENTRYSLHIKPLRSPPPNVFAAAAQHRESLEVGGPPSILIDNQYAILHVSETAGRYLLQPRGPITASVLNLVRPELQAELRSCLFHAFETQKAIVSSPIQVQFNGHPHRVVLYIRSQRHYPDRNERKPDGGKRNGEETNDNPENMAENMAGNTDGNTDGGESREQHGHSALVFFIEDESDEPPSQAIGDADADARRQMQSDALVRQLEAEVHRLRQRLQATVEEHESGTEELKAANEELQSINEEYRSTTEELETSKEELQSVNEELQTVNNELKNKLEEISRAHSDLENLMTATDIATLFLDRDLRINRYTPGMTRLFNLMPTDRGRPIAHLTHRLIYDNLTDDARSVLRQLTPIESEVRGQNGDWFLVRMRPYRTLDDRIDGVVLTFINITQIKLAEEELYELNESLERKVIERTEQVRTLVTELTMSEQEERHRISRVLHDDLQQRLYSLQFQLAILRKAILSDASTGAATGETTGTEAGELAAEESEAWQPSAKETAADDAKAAVLPQIRAIGEEVERVIAITRSLSVDLSPPILHDEGLAAAVGWLASQMQRQHGLSVKVQAAGNLPTLDEDLRVMLFQMVRELLFNVIKHAGVSEAQVSVQVSASGTDEQLRIEVSDHGAGFDRTSAPSGGNPLGADGQGHGLMQISRRLELVNGRLEIESAPGSGTRVTLLCPIRLVKRS